MKLSEGIAMVEDWLDECSDGYRITSVKPGFLADTYDVYFEEAFLNEEEAFITVDVYNRRMFNSNGNDILKVGRFANDNDPDWTKWYDEFEKKWRYGE